MTTRTLPTAAPPFALRVWGDGHEVFVEMPHRDPALAPYILRFPYHTAPQHIMSCIRREIPVVPVARPTAQAAVPPSVRRFGRSVPDSARDAATALLRRRGIIR